MWSGTVQMRKSNEMPGRTDCDSAVDCCVQQRVPLD